MSFKKQVQQVQLLIVVNITLTAIDPLTSGAGGREFKSPHPDSCNINGQLDLQGFFLWADCSFFRSIYALSTTIYYNDAR